MGMSPNSSHPCLPRLCPHVHSLCLCLFLPCKLVHLYGFSRFHIHALIYDNCFSFSYLLHSVWQARVPSMSLQMTHFHSSGALWWSRGVGAGVGGRFTREGIFAYLELIKSWYSKNYHNTVKQLYSNGKKIKYFKAQRIKKRVWLIWSSPSSHDSFPHKLFMDHSSLERCWPACQSLATYVDFSLEMWLSAS